MDNYNEFNDESLLPKYRLESLCDGIFSIAMTILILNISTPENIPAQLEEKEIPETLYALLPDFEAYAVSFVVLAIFWMRNQLHFKFLKYVNRKIIALNILFLLLIVSVPFSVGLMMKYENTHIPLVIYISNLLLISSLLSIQGWYISLNKKIQYEEIDEEMMKSFFLFTTIPLVIFILSLIVSFFSMRIAFLMIYLDPISYSFYRHFRMKSAKKMN